jgi:hypothetical protein
MLNAVFARVLFVGLTIAWAKVYWIHTDRHVVEQMTMFRAVGCRDGRF